jgi:hypothetical protein
MFRLTLSVLAVLAFASPALADEVVLRNGHKVTGIQREEKDRIVVETGYGTVSFPRDQVVSVTMGETPLHAYPVRFAEIEKSTNASDYTKLAGWAKENNMPRYVGPLMKRAMELDPENAEARTALGFVRHQGKWVTQAQLKKDQGMVQDGGRWVNPLEKALSDRKKIEAESRRLDREKDRRDREEKKRRQREDAELMAQIRVAESAPTMFDRPMYNYGHYAWNSGWGWYGDVYDLFLVDWLLAFGQTGAFPLSSLSRGAQSFAPPPGSQQAPPGGIGGPIVPGGFGGAGIR